MVLLACLCALLILFAGICMGALITREHYREIIDKHRQSLSMIERERIDLASRMESFEVDLRKRISGGY